MQLSSVSLLRHLANRWLFLLEYWQDRHNEILDDCSSNPPPEELLQQWEAEEMQKRAIKAWIRLQSRLVGEYVKSSTSKEQQESKLDDTVLPHQTPCPLSRPSTPSDFFANSVGDWAEAAERWPHPLGSDPEDQLEAHPEAHPVPNAISHEVELAEAGEGMAIEGPKDLPGPSDLAPSLTSPHAGGGSESGDSWRDAPQSKDASCEFDPVEVAMPSIYPDPGKETASGVPIVESFGYWDDPEDCWPEPSEDPSEEMPQEERMEGRLFEFPKDENLVDSGMSYLLCETPIHSRTL